MQVVHVVHHGAIMPVCMHLCATYSASKGAYMWSGAVGVTGIGVLYCREVMHAMMAPSKFSLVYLLSSMYVFTLTLPNTISVYWAHGDSLLTHTNASDSHST